MKKLAAILLTGCMALQPLSGCASVYGADVFWETEALPEAYETEQQAVPSVDVPVTELPAEGSAGGPVMEAVQTEDAQTEDMQTEGVQTEDAQTEGVLPEESTSEDSSDTEASEEPTGEIEEEIIIGEMMESESETGSESELESETQSESEAQDGGIMLLSVDDLAGRSYVEVKVISTQKGVSAREVTVSIADAATGKNTIDSRVFTIPNDGGADGSAKFEVAPGEYTVTVSADRFESYQQTLAVGEQQTAKIEVCTSKEKALGGEKSARGWMRLGDVNGDQKITIEDVTAILDAIRRDPSSAACNLTDALDSVVDIIDLQLAVQSLYGKSQAATVETLTVPMAVKADNETVAEGVENLLSDGGTATLKTKEGQTITDEHPVSMTFEFAKDAEQDSENPDVPVAPAALPVLEGMTIQAPAESEYGVVSDISSGTAEVVYVADGQEQTLQIPLGAAQAAGIMTVAAAPSVSLEPDGSLVLNFGSQIAVKRVTIKITGTTKQQPLVDIARVEFVNDMESRIPAPQMNIPANVTVTPGNEQLTVSWDPQSNVTGYEVRVEGPVKKQDGPATQIVRVSGSPHLIVSINDLSLKNFGEYKVQVRSINGEWSSPWSETVIASPKPEGKPAPVDNVVAAGGFRSIRVTWKDMDDANGYMLYYKRSSDVDAAFCPVVDGFVQTDDGAGRLTANSYTITGLEDGTEYELYVTGWNDLGWAVKESLHALAQTESGETPRLPNYRLINTSNGEGRLTAHIQSALCGNHGSQKMIDSPLDQAMSGKPTVNGQTASNSQWAFGVVDDSYSSYWLKPNEWDDGVAYPMDNFSKGITVTFDQEYKMNYLTFTAADISGSPERARVVYWNHETGNTGVDVGSTLIQKLDVNNRPFYVLRFHEPVTASQIMLCLGTGYSRIEMKVAEIHFHNYDPLDEEIENLFEDNMHTVLKADVTEDMIRALEERLNITDENGELHPLYDSLLLDLKAARELLKLQLDETIAVDPRITARRDGSLGFGGLNAWQPLGRTAAAGETLVVYVGHNFKKMGENTNLRLVFTQYHAEANTLMKTSGVLKVGRNEITVPQVSTNKFEQGGQIYVAYEGNDTADRYGIRVNGGVKIPVLNIYKKTGAEKTEAIRQYVSELETYVQTISAKHEENHTGRKNVDYAYDAQNCILNATDLMMERMMYSVPATQLWAAISGYADKAAQLESALDAIEKTMLLFYQHKGLSDQAGGRNALPSQHLNIRYMRMFAGAFMYASGNHIGVEWNETKLAGSATTWDGFGWGIAHEIGHDINQSCYAIAEITNNYFAQLLTKAAKGTRFQYPDVYAKVTSGAIGRSPNVGIQLALYWQLHLAYDSYTKDDRYIFDSYQDQFNNLFFARVDTYARDAGAAPKPKEVELKLDAGVDQNLMRLACASANKDILEFFERWGMVPDEATIAYAGQFEKETRAIWYVNDDARDYRVDHAGAGETVQNAAVSAKASAVDNQVTISMSTSGVSGSAILGYEIIRGMMSNGRLTSQVIGFQPADADGTATYVDTVSSINNRVMYYEVKAVDKLLNYSPAASAGSVKVATGGALNKDSWTVETTMTSADDAKVERDEDDPDGGFDAESGAAGMQYSISRIKDNVRDANPYSGVSAGDAQIVIDMHRTEEVTSARYMGSDLDSVTVSVSADGNNWITVKEAYEGCRNCASAFATIWFDSVYEANKSSWIGTYNARYVKFQIPQSGTISISEIDICGPSGDDLEFYTANGGVPAIGRLTQDYQYGKEAKDVIPQGSLIFGGTYKGNPAYNVVLLYDTEGNVIGAKDGAVNAGQVILAEVPENGSLGETSDGTWIYYVEPGNWDEETLKAKKGVRGELYRVDDAITLDGERIVSDTAVISIPDTIPDITLTNTGNGGQQ